MPRLQHVPDPRDLTPTDLWILECLSILSNHLRRGASVREMSQYVKRSVSTVHAVLSRLESAGMVERGNRGRFRVPALVR